MAMWPGDVTASHVGWRSPLTTGMIQSAFVTCMAAKVDEGKNARGTAWATLHVGLLTTQAHY
jgi:hypothetical protein